MVNFYPVGCFSILVVLGYFVYSPLNNMIYPSHSDEEINRLILEKKETWIQDELGGIISEKKDELYNKLLLRLGRADSTGYRADIQVLGSLRNYAKNICNKNNSITVQFLERGEQKNKDVYKSKLSQDLDCRIRLNNEINKTILMTLEYKRGEIKLSLDDIAWDMDDLNEKIQYDRSI